ncbi:DUF1430 domain-containing protein [Erysipelotrichaceae bacterium HCN-30851]
MNLQETIADNENKQVVSVELDATKDRNKFYNALITYVHEHGNTAMIRTSYQNKDMIDYNNVYLYTKQPEVSLQNMYLENEKKMDFTQDSSNYYSTDLASSSFDHIVFLDKDLNKAYQGIYQIYPFDEIQKDTGNDYYVFYILADDEQAVIEQIQQSELGSYLGMDMIYEGIEPTILDTSLLNKLLVISIIIVLLLTICDVLKKKKEVMIRKLYGMSSEYIVVKMYIKQFFGSIIAYFLTMILCYVIWIGNIQKAAYDFIRLQLTFFGLFVLLNILLWVLIYLLIRSMKSVQDLKKPAYLNVISYVDIILKAVILVILVQPIISFTELGIREVKNLSAITSNREELKNQFYIDSLKEDDEHELMYLEEQIKNFMNEHGAIYQDFTSSDMQDDEGNKVYEEPYIEVNTNYLKNQEILKENGEALNVDSIKRETVLVPKKYKESIDTSKYCQGFSCDVVIVENGISYLNHDPLTAASLGWEIRDPIVNVKDKIDRWSYPYVFLSYDDEKEIEDIKEELTKAGIEENIFFNTTDKMYQSVYEEIKDNCLETVFLLALYIIVILTFLYQSIFLYFLGNKEEFALKYIHGYSFTERHGEMMLVHIAIYVLPFLVGWFYFHMMMLELLIFLGMAIIFEVLAMLLLTKKFEKEKIYEILKGD